MFDVARVSGRKIFGGKLAKERMDADLSQEEFARRAGISRGTVARYETSGVVPVSVGSMRRMAEALKLSLEELQRRIGAPTNAPATEKTTIRLDFDLKDALRAAAHEKSMSIEEFLWSQFPPGKRLNPQQKGRPAKRAAKEGDKDE